MAGFVRNGARKRTRTSTTVRPLAPEASASASSAIRAQGAKKRGNSNFEGHGGVCQRNRALTETGRRQGRLVALNTPNVSPKAIGIKTRPREVSAAFCSRRDAGI